MNGEENMATLASKRHVRYETDRQNNTIKVFAVDEQGNKQELHSAGTAGDLYDIAMSYYAAHFNGTSMETQSVKKANLDKIDLEYGTTFNTDKSTYFKSNETWRGYSNYVKDQQGIDAVNQQTKLGFIPGNNKWVNPTKTKPDEPTFTPPKATVPGSGVEQLRPLGADDAFKYQIDPPEVPEENEILDKDEQQEKIKREADLANKTISSVGYSGLYTKYYSSSDFKIYIGDILLDYAASVAFSESLSSVPVYTIGNSRYSFLSRGNLLVSGYISINKAGKDYLARTLANFRDNKVSFKSLSPYEQMQLTADELNAYKEKEARYMASEVSAKSVLDLSDLDPFTLNLVYNNSDVISRGVQQQISIIECRVIGFEHNVDIGSDGQLIDGYKFIGKEVVPR